jgi:hypothetical protein
MCSPREHRRGGELGRAGDAEPDVEERLLAFFAEVGSPAENLEAIDFP